MRVLVFILFFINTCYGQTDITKRYIKVLVDDLYEDTVCLKDSSGIDTSRVIQLNILCPCYYFDDKADSILNCITNSNLSIATNGYDLFYYTDSSTHWICEISPGYIDTFLNNFDSKDKDWSSCALAYFMMNKLEEAADYQYDIDKWRSNRKPKSIARIRKYKQRQTIYKN